MDQLGLFFSELNTIFLYLIFLLNLVNILKISFILFFIYFFACECFVCMHVYVPHAQLVPVEARIGIPGTRVLDSCELPCRFWELNLSCHRPKSLIHTSTNFFQSDS